MFFCEILWSYIIIYPFLHSTASEWAAANTELTTSNRFVISGLPTGDLLNIRVVAMNAGGRSEPVVLPQPVPVREIMGECLCIGEKIHMCRGQMKVTNHLWLLHRVWLLQTLITSYYTFSVYPLSPGSCGLLPKLRWQYVFPYSERSWCKCTASAFSYLSCPQWIQQLWVYKSHWLAPTRAFISI